MFHPLLSHDALSDPCKLSDLTRGHTAQHNYVVRCIIGQENINVGVINE